MGLLGSLLSAAVKVAVTPLAVIADIGEIMDGDTPTNTSDILGSAVEDVLDGVDDLL